ncbi:MAG: ABC transporter ATP-binding protein [Candidatus Velthaea sp.]
MNDSVPAIEIRNLIKRYGEFVAVNGISFDVAPGEFFGLLGPNGAGKTTTINAMVGLASISAGSIKLFGHDVERDWRAARRVVGLAPQEYNFDRYINIRDVLIYQAGYYGLEGPAVQRRADELLERFDLASKAKQAFTRLSGGMKRRLTLARALIHEPQLLILDEPTAGVDIELRLELWEFLRELNAAGTTIVLTTHYLEEAETLCNRIGIIEAGNVVALESTTTLVEKQTQNDVLAVTLDTPVRTLPAAVQARAPRFTPGSSTIELEGIAPAAIAATLAEFERAGLRIIDVGFRRATLQDVFLELTRR